MKNTYIETFNCTYKKKCPDLLTDAESSKALELETEIWGVKFHHLRMNEPTKKGLSNRQKVVKGVFTNSLVSLSLNSLETYFYDFALINL